MPQPRRAKPEFGGIRTKFWGNCSYPRGFESGDRQTGPKPFRPACDILPTLRGKKWRQLHEETCSRLLLPVVFLRLWVLQQKRKRERSNRLRPTRHKNMTISIWLEHISRAHSLLV